MDLMTSNQREFQVNLGERSYPIRITTGELIQLGGFVRTGCKGTQALVVSDHNTRDPYADTVVRALSTRFQVEMISLPAGEATKRLMVARQVYDRLIAMAANRQTLVVAVGGGVIGDLAGFVAATFVRGVPLVQVPTTLLAQVDSSVGGKVAVNHHAPDGRITKNMIGAFHQPVGVFIDTETLGTLPLRELRAGLAEVIKYGVILDVDFFEFLESHVDDILTLDPVAMRHLVSRCCRLKADVVEADEREVSGRRAILNYGHTFAHAIEAVSDEFRHGEAVAVGMVAAARLSELLGRISTDISERLIHLLGCFGLPTRFPELDSVQLMEAMRRDKKVQAGRLRFVLPNRIGGVELVEEVDSTAVQSVLSP